MTSWEQYATIRELAPGEYVFREGDPADEIYIIQSGQVAVTKQRESGEPVVLNYRGPNELIGEISLIKDRPRTASVMAVKPSILLAMSRDDFWNQMGSDPAFSPLVINTLIESLLIADSSRVVAAVSQEQLSRRLSSLSSEQQQLAEIVHLRQHTIRFIVNELSGPLTLIAGALQVMGPESGDTRAAELLTAAQGSVGRLIELVNDMAEVEQLEQGTRTLNLTRVDVAAFARDTVARHEARARQQGLTLSADLPESPLPMVKADLRVLERAMTNLLDNAVKYTNEGGYVTVGAGQNAVGDPLLWVNDTGPGIPPAERERVFRHFVTTDAAEEAGFGLGLAYCHAAVVTHGGHIWIEDGEGGVGTKVIFALPALRE